MGGDAGVPLNVQEYNLEGYDLNQAIELMFSETEAEPGMLLEF